MTGQKKNIADIKEDLNRLETLAPITGTIVSLEIREGDKVVEGTTVGKIADLESLLIEVMVDEVDVNEVAVGQSVTLTSDSFEDKLTGEVIKIDPVATKVGNLNKYRTQIVVSDPEGVLKPGMFVNAEIVTSYKNNVITLPPLAVLGDEDKYVYVVEDGKAVKRPVELGLQNLTKVEVKGVKAGERVIIGPFTVLKDLEPGTPVSDVTERKKR